jgi:hypothetical protein
MDMLMVDHFSYLLFIFMQALHIVINTKLHDFIPFLMYFSQNYQPLSQSQTMSYFKITTFNRLLNLIKSLVWFDDRSCFLQ